MLPGSRRDEAPPPDPAAAEDGAGLPARPIPLTAALPAPLDPPAPGERAESPVARARRWGRERLGLADEARSLAPLRPPDAPQIPRLRRSALGAWWGARRERGALEEFLHGRLVGYLLREGVPTGRLPLELAVEAGGRVRAAPRATPPRPDWLAAWVRAHGAPALAADLRRAEGEAARAAAALVECRQRLRAAERGLEEAARAPSIAAAEVDAGGDGGRPAVPAPWAAAAAALVGLLGIAEAWQLALPLLRDAGVAPGELAGEASRRPEAVALPLLLAVAASVSVFVFAAAASRRARAFAEGLSPRGRTRAEAAAGAGALAATAAVAGTILAAPARARGVAPVLLAVALPLAASPLLALARRLHAARAAALAVAAAWDRVHHAAVARWSRQRALVDEAAREHAALEAARATWAQRALAIRGRAAEVERLAADAADAEARELRRLCEAAVAALELDRRAWARARPAPR